MSTPTRPDVEAPEPFFAPALLKLDACADESLLYDATRYESHKKAQLFRPPPVGASEPRPLAQAEGRVPESMARRRSHRRFSPEAVSWEALGGALSAFRHARDGDGVRALYPSTGGLYGLDFYIHVKSGRVERLPGGLYYYRPATHALHPAGAESALGKDIHHHPNRPVFSGSAFTLIVVFDSATTTPVYGPSSPFLASIEAGIALATFIQLAEIEGIGTCPIGLFDFSAVAQALSLRSSHTVLHIAECGRKPEPDTGEVPPAPAPPDLSVAGLRQFLASALPDYMVPSQFVLVDEVPLTPNNKVDREALLKMEGEAPLELGTVFAAAESEVEGRLLAIWRRVLKKEPIGVEDNFFDLGGDSMGVAEVHALILGEWKLDVPILKLFQYPTIRAAARYLRAQASEPAAAPAPAEKPQAPTAPRAITEAASGPDREALEWVRAHPQDPRAPAIAAKLRSRNMSV